MKINQILDKIDENHLFVPAFQREYVWGRDHVKNLISSLIKKYPTGTMLTWETNSPPELKGDWEYNSQQGAIKLILDGQQRITSLYLLVRDKIPPYYTEEDIKKDTRNLYVNLKTLDLQYYQKTLMENDPYWINTTDIFKKQVRDRDIIKRIKDSKADELQDQEEDLLYDNYRAIENILEYEFLEQSIPIKATLKEAIDIFYIVNASGVNLTEAELALAQISGYWPKAREEFKEKLAKLEKDGFVFKLDFIIYCLLGVLYNMGTDMSKLHGESNLIKIKEAWELLDKKVLDYVVNLLRTHAYVDHTKEINSVYALIPIILFVYNRGVENLTQVEIKKMIKWFYYSQIRQRYISQLPQKLDKDLGIVARSDNPFDELLNLIKSERPLEITTEEFVGANISNALYSLMRWYFKSKNAICFTTGMGIRRNMGEKYSLEWDHIFPYSLLKTEGYGMNNRLKYPLAQEITNRAILTQTANRSKGTLLAIDYLKAVKEKFPEALEKQSIPMDENLWEMDHFEDFLQARRELLTDQLNEFLNSITETVELESEMSIDELIKEGESSELEFKASFRYSYKDNIVDKKLEQVIFKTISAFSNADGGTLIIGVDDEGNILGLDKDYLSLGDRDKFELHFRNLLNKYFDKVFTASNVEITFPLVDDKEICVVNIKKGSKPIYLEVTDSNGQKQEKFYVRSGNSSQELSLSEMNEYIKTRF